MADDRFALSINMRVEHGQEMRGQLAVRALDSKVLLMVAHHRDQHLFGKCKIFRLKITQHDRRPLGEMNHRLDQRLVLAPARTGNRSGRRIEGLANRLPALGHIDEDEGLAQRFSVPLWRIKTHGVVTVQHAMASARVARLNARDFKRNNRRIEQRNDPTDGAHKALRLARAPVHILGPVEAEHFLGQFGSEHLRCGHSQPLHGGADVLALGIGDLLKSLNRYASLLGKGLGSRSRRAILEGDLPRWAGQLLLGIGLARQHALDQHGQTARRRIRGQFSLGCKQPLARKQFVDAPA